AALPGTRHRRPGPLRARWRAVQPLHHGDRPRGQAVTATARRALALAVALALSAASGAARAGHDSVPDVVALRSDYLKRLIDAREAVVLVDMRKLSEYRAGHLPGAISVPITELDRRFK